MNTVHASLICERMRQKAAERRSFDADDPCRRILEVCEEKLFRFKGVVGLVLEASRAVVRGRRKNSFKLLVVVRNEKDEALPAFLDIRDGRQRFRVELEIAPLTGVGGAPDTPS